MKRALIVEARTRAIRNLRVGDLFEDNNGQQFVKLGERVFRGVRKHIVFCTWSPMGRRVPGAIASAFFTCIGAVLYLGGNRPVQLARPALALPLTPADR